MTDRMTSGEGSPSRFLYRALVGLACVLLLCIGCSREEILVDKQHTFNPPVWTYADTLSYTFTVRDTQPTYNLVMDISHLTSYPFQNLYTQIHTRYPDGNRVSETLNIDFADHRGLWYGDCSGEQCEVRVALQERVRFDQTGSYEITFEQYTRRDSLFGIRQIRLLLKKYPEEVH